MDVGSSSVSICVHPWQTKQVFAAESYWKRLVPRLADVDQLPKDPALLKVIEAQ